MGADQNRVYKQICLLDMVSIPPEKLVNLTDNSRTGYVSQTDIIRIHGDGRNERWVPVTIKNGMNKRICM